MSLTITCGLSLFVIWGTASARAPDPVSYGAGIAIAAAYSRWWSRKLNPDVREGQESSQIPGRVKRAFDSISRIPGLRSLGSDAHQLLKVLNDLWVSVRSDCQNFAGDLREKIEKGYVCHGDTQEYLTMYRRVIRRKFHDAPGIADQAIQQIEDRQVEMDRKDLTPRFVEELVQELVWHLGYRRAKKRLKELKASSNKDSGQ